MKQFYTVVLDRLTDFKGSFQTEPYESGWADEAIAFVRIHEKTGRSDFIARLQISPDGIEWVDEGAMANTADEGVIFMRTTNFGGWLRIKIECSDDCKITTYLALKG